MELTKGGNTKIGPSSGPHSFGALLVGVQWESGGLECELTAIVCDANRKVLSDEHFLYWAHETTPSRDVFLLQGRPPHPVSGDRAQVVADLSQLSADVTRIVISLATVVDGANLGAVTSCVARVIDLAAGHVVATFPLVDLPTIESCMILVEVYQHGGSWKVRAVGQGYDSGLAGLGRDHGVNIV